MTGIILFLGLVILLTSFLGLVHHKQKAVYWFGLILAVGLILMSHGLT